MEKYLAIFITHVFCVSTITVASQENHSRNFYWTVDRSTPEKTLAAAVKAIGNQNYFNLYALASEDVIDSLEKNIKKKDFDIWAVRVDLHDVMLSDFGKRYGKVGIFDKVMQKISVKSNSWVNYIQSQGKEVFSSKKAHIKKLDKRKVAITFTGQDKNVVFYLVQNDEVWFLDNVKIDSEMWREE